MHQDQRGLRIQSHSSCTSSMRADFSLSYHLPDVMKTRLTHFQLELKMLDKSGIIYTICKKTRDSTLRSHLLAEVILNLLKATGLYNRI